MSTQIIGQGDIGVTLSFTVKTPAGPVDLTGATVTLVILPDMPLANSRFGTFPMVVSDPLKGVVTRVTDGTEFPNGNINYTLQIKIKLVNGNSFTSTMAKVFARPDNSNLINNTLLR